MLSSRMYTTKAILHANYALGQQNSAEIQKWPGTVLTLLDKEDSCCTLKKLRQKCPNSTKNSGEYRRIAQENGAKFWPWPLSGSGVATLLDSDDETTTYRLSNHINSSTENVLAGKDYSFSISMSESGSGMESLCGAIALGDKGEMQKFFVGESDTQDFTLENVQANYDIYPIFSSNPETKAYHYMVAVNGKWVEIKRPYYMQMGENGGRTEIFDAYLHDMYGKFYNAAISSAKYAEYLFGHNGDTTKSYNRKSKNGATTFFQTTNSSTWYLLYTPYIPEKHSGNTEEIYFDLNDDTLKEESFYTVALSDKLKEQYTKDELASGDLISGRDVAGDFPLSSIDNADFTSNTAFSVPNIIGHCERNVKVTVKMPQELIESTGKSSYALILRGVTNSSVSCQGAYQFDNDTQSGKYVFDLPAGALTQPFEATYEKIEPGKIYYQYTPPVNEEDSLEHTTGLQEFPSFAQWQAGYQTPTYSFNSYADTKKWTYTVTKWKDIDGREYSAGEEITDSPEPYLLLHPVWTWEGPEDRMVCVEYYNTYQDTKFPVETDNFYFRESETYTVLGLAEEWFYVQKEGKRYRFENWLTNSNETVTANATIDLEPILKLVRITQD